MRVTLRIVCALDIGAESNLINHSYKQNTPECLLLLLICKFDKIKWFIV